MSLFENDEYQWRETYFILFEEAKRPKTDDVTTLLQRIDPRYEIRNVRGTDDGLFESLTLVSPDDYAAMDISLVARDEVVEQMSDLTKELLENAITDEEKQSIGELSKCSGRFDIYHFEQLVFVGRESESDEDDFMDPGALLIVMDKMAAACDGVVVDPQANCLL